MAERREAKSAKRSSASKIKNWNILTPNFASPLLLRFAHPFSAKMIWTIIVHFPLKGWCSHNCKPFIVLFKMVKFLLKNWIPRGPASGDNKRFGWHLHRICGEFVVVVGPAKRIGLAPPIAQTAPSADCEAVDCRRNIIFVLALETWSGFYGDDDKT